MNLAKFQLFHYKLPLIEAFPRHNACDLWTQGLIVALHSGNGQVAYGEVTQASLALGESLAEAEKQIEASCLGQSKEMYAPVNWALSSARLNLELADSGIDFAKWMNLAKNSEFTLNALLDASRADFVDKGLNYHAQGFRVFKIKVGDDDLGLEIARIRELLTILGGNIVMRLDANRNLSLSHALEIVKSLKKASIEYFEEPFNDLDAINEFYRLTGVKVALDETIVTDEFDKWREHEAVGAYILKPSRIGSVQRLAEIMRLALRFDRKFIISSTYESGLGLSNLVQVASIKQSEKVAMGLATNAYFANDLITPPLRAFRGQFSSDSFKGDARKVTLLDSPYCRLLFDEVT